MTPGKHAFDDLAVGATSGGFAPGYLNDPESGAYDSVIDQKLFRVTGYKKGDDIVFSTEGAGVDIMMRLYDSKGNILAESLRSGDDSQETRIAWTATANYAAASAVYLGVCQQLEEDEAPTAGELTVSAAKVSLVNAATPITAVPDGTVRSPVEADGATPSGERSLGAGEWVNTFVLAARKGVKYRVKAAGEPTHGLGLGVSIYTLSGTQRTALPYTGLLDPGADGWLEFTPAANGSVCIDISVADGEWGAGKGLDYGPYVLYASAAGADLGILVAPMKGAPQDLMGWKILSGPGIAASGEVFYAAGTGAILPEGDYVLVAKEVPGFAKPDANGYAVVTVAAGIQPSVAKEYKYSDTADPLDDSPDAKAIEPSTKTKYAPAKLDPKSGKPVEASRSLWDDDPADWYTLAATAGSSYRFSLASKEGAVKMAVYGPDSWTKECEYSIFKDPGESLQISAEKGTYYVKVSHRDEDSPIDSSYALKASVANPGLVKFAKTEIAAKDSSAHVDLSVSRTSKDGLVRVKYRTEGSQSGEDDAYYYPTNGVLEWAAGDNRAQTVRVRLVPGSGWTTNKVVKVVLEPFSDDDETFDREVEFVASFDKDKKTGLPLDTATITVASSAKKAPGTVQVAGCDTPKKPVFTVTAGEVAEIPFERVLGADGIVGVRVETAKGTANKSGETDYTPVATNLVWNGGEKDAKVVSVQTKAVPGDYTAVKTLTLKLAALSSRKGDAVQYEKPTLASASVTVNIVNDKFADSMANYAKTVTAASDGYTLKEGKAGTWVVMDDGSFYAANRGDLTFAFSTTGTFTYTEDGVQKVFAATAKEKTLKVSGASTFSIVGYELDGTPVALYQGVKHEESFGSEGTVKATGLPGGLKLAQDKKSKEWILAGVPSKAGIFQAVFTVSAGGAAESRTNCYTVAAQGTSAGTFSGLATTFDTTNGLPSIASVTITAAAGGKLSAKVSIGGKSYAFADAGYAYWTGDPGDPSAPAHLTAELSQVQKVGSGKAAFTVTNWLYCTVVDVSETDPAGWYAASDVEIQMAALPDAKGGGCQEDVWYFGSVCRDNSKSGKDGKAAWESEMSKWAGYYTVSLVAPGAMAGEPQGSGYMTMTLDAKGKARLAGMLADGTTYSGSATAALAGDVGDASLRVPLYAAKGSSVFGGWLSVREDGGGAAVAAIDDAGPLAWKNDDPASTRSGEDGFALDVVPAGGWYDTVSNLQRFYLDRDLSIDLPEGEDALAEIMDALDPDGEQGYEFVAQPSGQAVDLAGNALSVEKQALVKDASRKNDWNLSANASNVKLTFKRATGIVSGTFDLWYEGTNAKGGAFEQKSISGLKHYGVLVPVRGDDGYLGDDVLSGGFFLAPQTFTDTVGAKKATRKWTGSYRFDIKAARADRDWSDPDPGGM